jgi:hypothetical protein
MFLNCHSVLLKGINRTHLTPADAVYVTFNLFPLGMQANKKSPHNACRSLRCTLHRHTKAKLFSCLMFFVSRMRLRRIQIPTSASMFVSSVITAMDGVVPNTEWVLSRTHKAYCCVSHSLGPPSLMLLMLHIDDIYSDNIKCSTYILK